MAYITCKQCGCQMSDKSEACPVCGAPVRGNIEDLSFNDRKNDSSPKKKNSLLIICFSAIAIIVGIVVFMLLRNNSKEQNLFENKSPEEVVKQESDPLETKIPIVHFMGTIANSNVHMSIMVDGAYVKGKYYYDSQREKGNLSSIIVFGSYNNNYLDLSEHVGEKTTGQFKGNWSDGQFTGTFIRNKDGKEFPFSLVEAKGGIGFYSENELKHM